MANCVTKICCHATPLVVTKHGEPSRAHNESLSVRGRAFLRCEHNIYWKRDFYVTTELTKSGKYTLSYQIQYHACA